MWFGANSVASLNVLTVFFLPMSDEFLWNRTQISGAASLGALLGAGVAVMTGRILDQTGPRVILAIGALITTISMIALSQISAIMAFYIFYGAARVSDQGFIQAVSPSTIAKWFDSIRFICCHGFRGRIASFDISGIDCRIWLAVWMDGFGCNNVSGRSDSGYFICSLS